MLVETRGGTLAVLFIRLLHSMPRTQVQGEQLSEKPGTEMEWSHGSPGQRSLASRVKSRVSVSDPVFDPVLSFNMRVYRGVVSTE